MEYKYRNIQEVTTSQYLYSGASVGNFKTRAEQAASYFTAKGCSELISLFEETVAPFYNERISNTEKSIEIYKEWLEILKESNSSIKKAFDKLSADYEKLLKTVPDNVKPFITTASLGFKWNLPMNFKSAAEASTWIAEEIDREKERLQEAKSWLKFYTEFYNKAKTSLAEMQ